MSSDEEAALSSSSSSSPPLGSHYIGRKEDIVRLGRVTRLVDGSRDVLVLHHRGQLYAMDMRCYHAGGGLQNGDIEEFNGRSCIVCPWHKYKITLAEGEGLYQAVPNPTARPLRTEWRSKGVKQRVHQVTEVRGDVYVTLDSRAEEVESDRYQTDKYRTTFCNNHSKTNT
ncbi:hypothetical protein WMY93_003984 [Mugilogobius chulae]|uniref:Rieske domain-containing protein n=1 Tax=Mugilogobius chulae TaxID=88201 RepID=A0AAW0PYM3_9GOBI